MSARYRFSEGPEAIRGEAEGVKSSEIREKYLSFFESKGCQRWPSSSLIPDDPSLLLTVAGMVQFKPYFLQEKQLPAPYIGTTTAQKCVRTNDIDIIGTTGRHLSFFEMLGNFSFGAYFKKEMCAWAYEFSTEVLGFEPERLYFTVYLDDDETVEIWKGLGVPDDHITRLGEEDNFWRAGPTGPCGPCSELYYDQGPDVGCGRPDCAPGCDCDRFLEYWNLVFTQFDAQEDGTLAPLPKKNIDTGMGLERVAAISQGVQTNYETDILRGLIGVGEKLMGKTYGQDAKVDLSLRIIADHARSVTFMIGDGVLPSNEGRGYVLRRLLRRAVRHGHLQGIEGPFLGQFVDAIIDEMGSVYPEIAENEALIQRVVAAEEERFGTTLRQGLVLLDGALDQIEEGGTLAGTTAFELHDTYGFPFEITAEVAHERGVEVDREGFDAEMTAQRERARAARTDDAWSSYGSVFNDVFKATGATEFIGYEHASSVSTVAAIVVDGEAVEHAEEGTLADVVLDRTPFYGQMGGQVGDHGTISNDNAAFRVDDTVIPEKGLYVCKGLVTAGTLSVGEEVTAAIDERFRSRVCRNHTATHILHWALRRVLGDHVKQAGSLVAPDRLRFDFTHFEAVTPEQLKQVESLANEKIMGASPVTHYETSLSEARAAGVMALFGEKYGERVRVLECGDFSKELCGGTHVSNTSEIGFLKIVSEGSVGNNLRRIEAITSYDALAYMDAARSQLETTAALLNVQPSEVVARTTRDIEELKDFRERARRAKQAATGRELVDIIDKATRLDLGYPVLLARIDDVEAGNLRNLWDIVRGRMEEPGALVFAAKTRDGKAALMAAGTDEAVAAGFDAGALIKKIAPVIGGRGGGRPSMAQAGGNDVAALDAALDEARVALEG